MINIYYIKITEDLSFDVMQKLLNSMPTNIVDEVLQYKFIEQQQHSLLGKKILQYALQKNNLNYDLATIQYQKKDKPYLSDEFDFNISHSGEYVCIALSKSTSIGIDVEKHRPIDIHLFKKYFNDDEWQNIINSSQPEDLFFDYWTIKEAAIKCDGRGVEILGKTNIYNHSSLFCDETEMYYKKIFFDKKYSATFSCTKPIEHFIIEEVNVDSLLNS